MKLFEMIADCCRALTAYIRLRVSCYWNVSMLDCCMSGMLDDYYRYAGTDLARFFNHSLLQRLRVATVEAGTHCDAGRYREANMVARTAYNDYVQS